MKEENMYFKFSNGYYDHIVPDLRVILGAFFCRSLLITLLMIPSLCFGQWDFLDEYYEQQPLNTPYESFGHGRPVFASSQKGYYTAYHHFSPSTGTDYFLFGTEDQGATWEMCCNTGTNSWTFGGLYAAPPDVFVLSIVPPVFTYSVAMSTSSTSGFVELDHGYGSVRHIHPISADLVFIQTTNGLRRCLNGNCVDVDTSSTTVINPRIHFIDENIGFKMNMNGSYWNGTDVVLKTENGGADWDTSFYSIGDSVISIDFSSDQHGYIGGRDGRAWKTVDQGATWNEMVTGIDKKITSVLFLNDTIGYMAADSGIVIRTSDAGATWTIEYLMIPVNNVSLYFGYPDAVLAVDDRYLHRTYPFSPSSAGADKRLEFSLFPNPTDGISILKGLYKSVNELIIRNIHGSEVLKMNVAGRMFTIIDLRPFESGVYYITINSIYGQSEVLKCIKID